MKEVQNTEIDNAQSMRKKRLVIVCMLLLILGLVTSSYYLLVDNYTQTTDNAYIKGHIININSRLAGSVIQVNVDNSDQVQLGDTLIKLDPDDSKIELTMLQANLADIRHQVAALYSKQKQSDTKIKTKKIQLAIALSDWQARKGLGQQNIITKEELRHAEDSVKLAKSLIEEAVADKAEITALIAGASIDNYPTILAANERVAKAKLDLQRTVIKTPVSGMVAQRTVQLGQQIKVGEKLMSIVPLDKLWVEANFKETQLKGICPGQPVEITVDSYGHKIKYHGQVQNIMAGSGSSFAVLPAQNATGNWIKVIQRVPVRIQLNPKELKQYPLRIGLSAEVTINTKHCSKLTHLGTLEG